MSQRRAVTKATATRYKRGDKASKGVMLDELFGRPRGGTAITLVRHWRYAEGGPGAAHRVTHGGLERARYDLRNNQFRTAGRPRTGSTTEAGLIVANIARRQNGRWRARYRDEAGKEYVRHFGRKIEAQRWLDEVTAPVVTEILRRSPTSIRAQASRRPGGAAGFHIGDVDSCVARWTCATGARDRRGGQDQATEVQP